METHAVVVTGTFGGHVLPGTLLFAWGLFWVGEAWWLPAPLPTDPLERTRVLPVAKLVLPLLSIVFELPGPGWFPVDAMMGWQHIAMYVGFALTGVADLLARSGRVTHRAGHAAYAAALVNAGLLFWGHGAHGGVPGVAHTLLALTFFAAAAAPLAELVRPPWGIEWLRRASLMALGSWFLVIAWILYRSGWDMADPVREGWTYVLFSANGIGVAAVVLAARLLAQKRGPAPAPREA